MDHLAEVAGAVPDTPVMRKDFLVEPVQITEARNAGASGVLLIATMLSENPRINAYLAGGLVRHRTLGTAGDFVEQMLSAINADTAFLAAEGFSASEGLTYSYEADATIARIMNNRAAKTVVLATARKLGQRDRMTAIPASRVDVLITDCRDENTVGAIRDLGVSVIVASKEENDTSNVEILSVQP